MAAWLPPTTARLAIGIHPEGRRAESLPLSVPPTTPPTAVHVMRNPNCAAPRPSTCWAKSTWVARMAA